MAAVVISYTGTMQLLTQIQTFLDVPAPRAQFLFITGSLNAVCALIFQVYDVLEHLDTGTVCFSCDPIEKKNMFIGS